MNHPSAVESLESRIAPASALVLNEIPDIVAGIGQTGATIDLGKLVDGSSYRTLVEFTTNYTLPGTTSPAKIVIELYDDVAPLTVQNFISYVNGKSGANYDGTFFHRIFDFQGDGTTDIIQAGGFDVANLTKHIPTGPTLHNEYSDAHPNERGTIAMAKTAVSPHTATSEWFINLQDNTSILGSENNGGFTVFGRIVQGLDVIDAIGTATKVDLGGALTDLAVQDSYVSGVPKGSDLIQIVDAKVLPALAGVAGGNQFTEVTVKQPGTDVPSTLLKATIDSSNQLKLTYTPGATGVAEVSVKVQTADGPMWDTFTVTIKPNLTAELVTHTLPQTFVPGQTGVAKVKLTNNAGGLAKGQVQVNLYLSPVVLNGNSIAPETFNLDSADQLLESKIVSVNLRGGKSATIPVKFSVEDVDANGVVVINGKEYVVLVGITPVAGGTIDELFSDDNTDARRTGHLGKLEFGSVGGRSNVPITITGPEGPMTFTLKGNGTGTITKDAAGNIDITINGTNAASVLSVKTKASGQFVDDVTINNPIGHVKFGSLALHGDFSATGGAKNIVFGDLGNPDANEDRNFSVNIFPIATQRLSLTVGAVHDYSLSSSMPLAKLFAKTWENDAAFTAPNDIFVAGLSVLRITGNLEANVTLTSDARINQFIVGGTLENSTVKTFGDIGSIKLGNMIGSAILAGLNGKPDSLADFALGRSIGSFSVTGTVADSIIAAARINSIVLGNVDKTAGTEVKGIYADAIKSYVRKGVGGTKLTRLDTAGVFDAANNFEVALF